MAPLSCGRAIVSALTAHGVDTVFGIPGTHTLGLHEAIAESTIRHVAPRHEQGGGYAADAYARASGRPGVCMVTTGPGLTNLITAAATAHHDSIPMLIVTPGMPGDVEGRDAGFLHQVKDQSAAMQNVVDRSVRVASAGEAVEAIDDAFARFASQRPRPVHIEVPVDVLDGDSTDRTSEPQQGRSRPMPQEAELRAAAQVLDRASEPWLLLGGGSVDAAVEARRLAERLGAVVVTTVSGKGVVAESHPLSIGASLRLTPAREALAAADVVVAAGTEIAESDLWTDDFSFSGGLIRVDIDQGQLRKNADPAVSLHGDAAPTLAALGDLLEENPARRETAARRAEELRMLLAPIIEVDGSAFVALHKALRELLGPDAIVTGDSSQVSYYGTVHQFPVDQPRCFLYPVGYATLGYSLPAAIGAKLALPERQVVAIDGDGGFLFTATEIATAAELGLPLPIIVFDNSGYGEIRDEMIERGAKPIGVDQSPVDFAGLSEALGGRGVRLGGDVDGMGPAVEQALSADGPTLIELRG